MVKSNADFVHIHCHSEYSRFDGMNKMAEWVLHARKMGFKALALTDHGNIGGWIKFATECKKEKDKGDKEIPYPKIKPIFGQEFYLAKNHLSRGFEQQPDGKKGNRHLLLLAKNWKGYENLCALSQKGFTDGQAFGSPRIDLSLLAEHSEGLICSSACLSSVINSNLLAGRYDQAKKVATVFKDMFGDDFYLEVMCHGLDSQIYIIPDIYKLGKELGIKVVASNDCHYCKKDQAKSQELLMAMSSSRCIKDPKAYKSPYSELYLKSAEEMYKIFGSTPEVLHNSVEISDKVEDFLKYGGMRLPTFNIEFAKNELKARQSGITDFYESEEANNLYKEIEEGTYQSVKRNSEDNFKEAYAFLQELAQAGMKSLGWDKSEEHIKQLDLELADIKVAWEANKMDFATYFLIVWQYINYARSQNILTGCGRGSGYASVLLRTLGITYGPDPLKYGLIWERFLAFDDLYFVSDSDWGFDEVEDVVVDIADVATDDLDEEREVEDDEGGVDRY